MALTPIISVTSLISLLIIVQIIRANPLPQSSQGNPSWNGTPGQVYIGQGVGWNGQGQSPGWSGQPGQLNSGQSVGWNGQGQSPGWSGQPGQLNSGQSVGWDGQVQSPVWNGQVQSPGWNGQSQNPGWNGQSQSPGEYSYQNQYPTGLNYPYQQPYPNAMNQFQPPIWNYGYNPNNNNPGSVWNRGQTDPGTQLGLSQFPLGNGFMNNIPPGGPLNNWWNTYGSVSGSYPNLNVNQRSLDTNENTTPKEKQ